MAWIESHDDLATHPKTRRAARALGISIPTMVGHLHLLWHWCLKYADDGDLSGYDLMDIADAMMWDGDPDELITALVDCGPGDRHGFLERREDGSLEVHDWLDYAGKLIEQREEARKAGAWGNHVRWHVQRGIIDPDCPHCREATLGETQDNEVPIGERSGGDSGGDRVLSHRTVPYQTVPYQDRQTDSATTRQMDKPEAEDVGPSVGQSVILGSDVDQLAEPSDDMTLQDATRRYQHRIGILGPSIFDRMLWWHEEQGVSAGVLALAIDLTAEARAAGRCRSPDKYLDGILRNSVNEGIKSVSDWREKERDDASSAGRPFGRGKVVTEEELMDALREAGAI